MMIKLLINITDLLKRLGLFAIVLLPALALVILAAAFYVACLGICEIIRALSTHVFCLRQKKRLINDLMKDGETGRIVRPGGKGEGKKEDIRSSAE